MQNSTKLIMTLRKFFKKLILNVVRKGWKLSIKTYLKKYLKIYAKPRIHIEYKYI